ncbi:uncharacterized protein SPSK_08936 [Sporothrix schenckii 1099-18]|uniref:Adhesin domain-containing protein n=2 Tax=Sporothrix schenckii TaxID=29908 RepID=U7Q8T3_SPOS1|nr:uncharacterized protein SPSK_08936 [Sporothrix schenckii 1099-18]ERT03440.1 hypothetical protein HMPREF1624_01755 [Sporothrix schenckii ATCC 58251]KJR84110.1 hypothetical protein SPSK_08936 [Sporothrix schenckii 1099-18]
MGAENEPLLVVYQKGESQPHMGDFDTSGIHDSSQEIYRAAAEARRLRRRRKIRRAHHFFCTLLIVTIAFYTHGFGLPALFSKVFRYHSYNGSGDFVGLGSTPLDGPLELPDDSFCSSHGTPHTYPVSSYPLTFDGEHSLTIRQNTTRHLAPPYDPPRDDDDDHRWRHVHVSGEVVVRQVVDGKEPSVEVEALSNDDRIRTTYVFGESGQHLNVIVDDRIWVEKGEWRGGRLAACLVVRVTVWVPDASASASAAKDKDKDKEVHLQALYIGAVHLGVQLIDNLDLIVDESARLSSVVGSIVASRALPGDDAETSSVGVAEAKNCHEVMTESIAFAAGYRFEAPKTTAASTSGPIRGPWSLLDSLHLQTVSGSINVAVRQEGTVDEHKELAHLSVESVSGSIGLQEVTEEGVKEGVIPRPHRLTVSTRSGTTHGIASFAHSARLHTVSGSIAFALAPQRLAENVRGDDDGDEYTPALLDTDTISGKTVVYLLNETSSNTAIDFLESTHHTVSGAVELHYPASWVGDIHLKTVAGGALVVEGKGVHVVPDNKPKWPPKVGRKVDAIKEGTREEDRGNAEGHRSTLNADTVSGRIRLSFPE